LDAPLKSIPLGLMGTPNDVAGLETLFPSVDTSYISGSTFVVDGGLMRSYREQ
jgi:glucose 1-dehydrogenase